jgi:HK97 family phage major capsid protein
MIEHQLYEAEKQMLEAKDITTTTGAAGGFAVPEEISREIGLLEKKMSPVRDLIKVVQTGTSDYKELITIHGTTSGWVGEITARPATATSTLREVVPTNGELYAYPQVSEWALDDIFFNVDQWLAETVAREFAIQEGIAVISGNGTTKPTGMLNTAPVSTADYASPLRAAAAYQFVASAASPDAILPDSLISLVYTLNTAYRAASTFVMNSLTTGLVRRLKDTTNQYLWAPGLAGGQPDRLLGYPVQTWEDMQDVGANLHPVAFGDFRQGYVLAERVGMRITRDNVTNIGFVKLYVRRREGGIVLNNDAIKFLKTT